MSRVTVIIPTFNRAGYLGEALASAASQDFDDLVVVVADNASEDDTRAVVESGRERYGAQRVEYVRRPTNVGWIANFNLALAEVQSEFALVLGDDDRLLPGAMTRAVASLDRAPTAGFVHSAFETIDEHGALVDTATDWTKGLTADTLETGSEFIERTIPWMARVFTHGVLLRHAAFPEVMWDPADGLSPDYFLWLRIALDWDVQYLAEPGAQRRVHVGGLSAGFGGIAGDDYEVDPEAALALRADKLRFISTLREPARAPERASPRRVPRQPPRPRCVQPGGRRALTARRRACHRPGAASAAASALDPWTWRAVAKVIVGPRASARLGAAEARHHTFQGGVARLPELLEDVLLPERVHRLPEAIVLVRGELALLGEGDEHLRLPPVVVAGDQVERGRLDHEVPAVDRRHLLRVLLEHGADPSTVELEDAEPRGRAHRGHRRQQTLLAVEVDDGADVDVGHAVPVGQAERLARCQVPRGTEDATRGHRALAGVRDRHLPPERRARVVLSDAGVEVERDVGVVEREVREVLLELIAAVSGADDELVDPVVRIGVHDVPDDRTPTDLDERLRA
jgi:hypothetical protein